MADKIGMYALAIVALGGLGWLFNHQIQARVVAENRASQAELVAELAERERDRMSAAVEAEKQRANDLADELQEARTVEAEAIAVLEDRSRLARLTNARPGLIEIRARKATTAVWETIEAEANARE